MKFSPTPLEGLVLIDVEPHADERGLFARVYCEEEFARAGLRLRQFQCSVSFNPLAGTLRGMHWQVWPHAEAKLVRCTSGAIFDVAVDVRAPSATFGKWFGVELSSTNRRSLFIPEGFAHGFLTLAADSEVSYGISVGYNAASARGLRWNDPVVGIAWPTFPALISQRDASLPDLQHLGAADLSNS